MNRQKLDSAWDAVISSRAAGTCVYRAMDVAETTCGIGRGGEKMGNESNEFRDRAPEPEMRKYIRIG